MFPPSQGLRLDIDAISQICGSVSIACWIVVFSPQIIENWRRGSAEGLSVVFIVIWLLGDFFNIIGAVLQGVLPTMIILAVYYTFADIVLLCQYFWYEGFTLTDKVSKPDNNPQENGNQGPDERRPLLSETSRTSSYGNGNGINGYTNGHSTPPRISDIDRRGSQNSHSSFRERFLSIDGTHLSPATPMLADSSYADRPVRSRSQSQVRPRRNPNPPPQQSAVQTVLFNLGIIVLVCASGVFGWWLSAIRSPPRPPIEDQVPDSLTFSLWGQISGYICALLYLGSRMPQLHLNYKRKSVEGLSMLFFLFACIGNLTYVLSIVAYKPICRHPGHCEGGEARKMYGRYIAVNASWLLGSLGTLVLDACVFVQYFMYRKDEEVEGNTA